MYQVIQTDVLVIGSGLAGCSAAVSAAEQGVDVILLSSLQLFSGSSFFPGTWGFGLVAPKDEADYDHLCETIQTVGMGIANPTIVKTFVEGIPKAIQRMECYGVQFLRANNQDQKEFIPCFDYKTRSWYGIIQDDAKRVFTEQLTKRNVNVHEFTTIISLIKEKGAIVGALGICNNEIVIFEAKSYIIATGGMGGLFEHSLNTKDVCAMGHYLAMESGATLINMEFFQMMLGFLNPCYGTIFNEKVYRYSEFYHPKTGENIFSDLSEEAQEGLLELRSMHGPFTSRLDSYKVDERIYKIYLENPQGVLLKYKPSIKDNQPEFVKTYFDWLKEKKNLTEDDPVHLGVFYHAANGGIQINEKCETGIKGLFACGEVTGGMHGADRIGGLSTANGLVFGDIAGKSAAACVQPKQEGIYQPTFFDKYKVEDTLKSLVIIEDAKQWIEKIQHINYRTLMVVREEKGLKEGLKALEKITQQITKTQVITLDAINLTKLHESYKLLAAIKVSKHLMNQALNRKESKGSHYLV